MRLEFINRVKAGEVLSKNILTNDGGILLRAGVTLTEQYIQRLQALGVFYVYIEDVRLDDIPMEDVKLSELKQNMMKNMSRITRNISIGDKKDTKECLSVVEDLVNYVEEIGDVNSIVYDIQTYDNYTYIHSLDTCIMAAFMGVSLGFQRDSLRELGVGAVLHDIGKLEIANTIISKTGKLTCEEFEEIKRHPLYGEQILKKNLRISDNVISAVVQHHEKIDGSGYPYGLERSQISQYAKIVSICDVYDAVSNDRSYRKRFTPNEAYELILGGSGTYFDEDMVLKFKDTFAVYPLGSCLKLSNGVEGYVVRQNKSFPDRPVLRILYDAESGNPVPFHEIDLLYNKNLTVKAMI